MTILFGKAEKAVSQKNTIGLVGVSSLQKMGDSVERFFEIFWTNPSQVKNAMGYVLNGHTALFARINGVVKVVAGWDPNSFSETAYKQYILGQGYFIDVKGCWRQDAAMFDDSSAHMLEVEVDVSQAEEFRKFLGLLLGTTTLSPHLPIDAHYTFKPADLEKRVEAKPNHVEYMNCGNAAFLVLCQFLYEFKKQTEAMKLADWVKHGDDKSKNFSQGRIMAMLKLQSTAPLPLPRPQQPSPKL